MAEVIIYATRFCPYCHAAKRLLRDKGVEFQEIDVTFDPKTRRKMTELAGGRHTVPQIFINGHHVGGYDDLSALDKAGKLDPLLRGEAAG
ncbi:glutaredoxin 3 [Thermopetrobacter sp. TC1]|uniref:glutaredoxin 3 n=1 Tax=Thermopetrobacter sp. TC1 TaxID=1495045 RepID=UPI00056FFA5A|nr:glutaredoxin 3 [Thermopetrobacter sp. TC1]